MMKKNNISNLVNLSQKGSNTAFEILFTTFKTRLHNSLFKILKNFHETEDVVQQAFLRAWEKIGTFKGESNFYTWLYRIGFNLAITKIKTSRESQIDEGFEQTIKSKDDVQNEIQNIEKSYLSATVIPTRYDTVYLNILNLALYILICQICI